MAHDEHDREHSHRHHHHHHLSDRELLLLVLNEVIQIRETLMSDFTALNAAVATLDGKVDQAIALIKSGGGADQAAVDAATTAVGATVAKLDAVLTPPPPPPPPAPGIPSALSRSGG